MDTRQYSTLMDALNDVPDPRKRRGKRHTWSMLLTLLVAGLASGYQRARAIAHWAKLHADDLQHRMPAWQASRVNPRCCAPCARLTGPCWIGW